MPSKKVKKTKIQYVHERDGKLYVRVPYQDGSGKWKTKEKRISNESEAYKTINEIKEELGEYGVKAFDGEKMTFDQLIIEYKKICPDSSKYLLSSIEEHFNNRRIRSITYSDLKSFKNERKSDKKTVAVKNDKGKIINTEKTPIKAATVNRTLELLQRILLYAMRHGWIKRDPFKAGPTLIDKSEEESRKRIPTPDEIERLLAVCIEPREHLRGLVIASLDTGLRRAALTSLTWKCIHFDKNLIYVPPGNSYKKRPEVIGITGRLEDELKTLWEKSDKKPDAKIFGGIKDFKRAYATACRLARIEGLRFNDLRHGYATGLMEADVPKHLAMKLAGHSNDEIHNIYTNIDERLAREAAEALNRLHEKWRSNQTVESMEYIN